MHGVNSKDMHSFPVMISKIFQSSGDMTTAFQQMETGLYKIVGPACQKIHFMVLDDELANTIAQQGSGGSQRLAFRRMTVGAALATLVSLKRTKNSHSGH